jgi:DNA polymerase III sliding clamp (beta) subunit (PCNA family)
VWALAIRADDDVLDDYPPPLAVEDGMSAIDLTAADVMAIFDGAAAGAATDDRRIYLNGPIVFSEPTDFGHRLCSVGADDKALSYVATTVACPDLGPGVLVHRDTCKLAVNLFGKTGASLRLGKRLVEFASDCQRLVAKQIDARLFPGAAWCLPSTSQIRHWWRAMTSGRHWSDALPLPAMSPNGRPA